MGRLDGPTVASISCTCSGLRDTTLDQELWRRACHSIWPSTSLPGTDSLITDFKRFYGESYSLIFYRKKPDWSKEAAEAMRNTVAEIGPWKFQDFTSLVDVYYKRRCILSRASVPVTETGEISHEDKTGRARDSATHTQNTWFTNCPFQWDILEFPQSDNTINGYTDSDAEHHRNRRTKLEENLRLSWVLLNKKTGKSVNLSSREPIFSQRSWGYHGRDYIVHFGCIIPVDRSLFPQGIVKCTIAVSCSFKDGGQAPVLEEISLHIEDTTGKHLNGKESLIVLNRALLCPRTTNKTKVKEGFSHYEMKKREFMRKIELKERVAITLFASVQVTVLVALVCLFTTRFTL
ncbi:probable F-box protein At2g36090 [Punica granatum]|nr:probable F-box protein At2g36090 [Punica granatum]PKI38501.1 hypothetical protein CRG98_041103 [Punica granatum]